MDSDAFDARQFNKWLENTTDRDLKDAIFYVLAMRKDYAKQNPELDEKLIDTDFLQGEFELSDPHMRVVHKVIATNDTTPGAILDWLSSVDDEYVRVRVAENKNTPKDTFG